MPTDPEMKVAHYATKKGEVVLRPHEYDGIQEYDQKLPNWWLVIFYGSIALFVFQRQLVRGLTAGAVKG